MSCVSFIFRFFIEKIKGWLRGILMFKPSLPFALLSLSALLLSSCASIVSGPYQKIWLDSTPQGAQVEIVTEDGKKVVETTTPTKVKLRRGAGYFRPGRYVAIFHKSGYEKEKVPITNDGVGNWWVMGDIVFGGLFSLLVIEPLTGAMYVLRPDEIHPHLTPVSGPANKH